MLKDQVIVITGASRGLGRSLAQGLASRGANVIVSARNKEELDQIAQEIGGTAIVADVADEAALRSLAEQVVSKFGRIDIWINNAGIWVPHGPIEDVDMEKVHRMFEVNIFGTMYGSRAAISQMKKQDAGTIVNIVSSSALSGRALASSYATSKWAVRGFTDSLREELKGSNIKVVGVYPGGIQTHLFDEKQPPEYKDFMSAESVSAKIIENLESETPLEEQILKRPA